MRQLISRKHPDHSNLVWKMARDLSCTNNVNPTIFHCYWNGELNEKHLGSLKSCYCFHSDHKIILWLENTSHDNPFLNDARQYAEIRWFDIHSEINNTKFEIEWLTIDAVENLRRQDLPFYTDMIRCLLLFKYGGIWFDLDILFLRSIVPIIENYRNEIVVYEWENQCYPNNAFFMSLDPGNMKLEQIIDYILKRNRGWGFQQSHLSYDLPLDFLVLPCEWFDAGWVDTPHNMESTDFFFNDFFLPSDKIWNLENFFPGAFCYHWHNKWNDPIASSSMYTQLMTEIERML